MKKIRLTTTPDNYIEPSIYEVDFIVEDVCYEGYLPINIFRDLTNMCYMYNKEGHWSSALRPVKQSDSKDFFVYIEFYESLDFDFYCSINDTPARTAMSIIIDLSKTVNLRKMEEGDATFNVKPDISNYKHGVSGISESYHKVIAGDNYKASAQEILNYADVLMNTLPLKNKLSSSLVKAPKKMSTISDVIKVKKSEFVKPTFTYNLLMKKLITVKSKPDQENSDVIVYLEDATTSMTKGKGYTLSRAVQGLLLEDSREVHYYRYSGDNVECFVLKSSKEKLECFTQEHLYHTEGCDYESLLKSVLTKYTVGNVIIVTDAQDNIPRYFKTSMKIFCIDTSDTKSLSMRSLCRSTGGKYLKIS